jgi:hypothetical protein
VGGNGYAWVKPTPEGELVYVSRLLVLNGQPLVVGGAIVHDSRYPYPQTALLLFENDGGFSSNPPQPGPGKEPPPPQEDPSSPIGPPFLLLPHEPPPLLGPTEGGHKETHLGGKQQVTNAVQAALAAMLRVKSPPITISGLLKHGACKLRFDAPVPGGLTVIWTAAQVIRAGHTVGRVVIATGFQTFGVRGRGVITLRLAAVARKLLRKAPRLRVSATASFRPIKAAVVKRQATIIVRG